MVTPAAELLLATDPARAAVKLAERTPPPSDASLAAFDALVSDPPPWWLPVDLLLVAMLRESLEERVSLRAETMAGNLAASKELRALDPRPDPDLEEATRRRAAEGREPARGFATSSPARHRSRRSEAAVLGHVFERNGPRSTSDDSRGRLLELRSRPLTCEDSCRADRI